ncbi:MAG: M18 family aminopeptidase, partial [Gammaproteobacteria bacterium]|nr:M18 family aminopeptidase [Gammaproteobacteria bacterium]
MIDTASRAAAQDLLNFIDISPSPWHVAANAASLLQAAGFQPLSETASWQLQPGGRYYVIRDESSLIAFHLGSQPLAESGYRIVGAHTDSPGLRVKPVGTVSGEEPMIRLGVEVYGGPILATFTDRDLSLAGRVSLKTADGNGIESRLVHFAEPLVRLPNLAIHMNRTVNTDGLKLHKTKELPLILAALGEELPAEETFVKLLAEQLEVEPETILAWELAVFDTQPGAFYG